jgi:hypothetical protein
MYKCPAYKCGGILLKNAENFTCDRCYRTYGKTPELKDYKDYEDMFNDDLVVAVRNLLKRIEEQGDYELEDSEEHNDLIEYFNKFGLHKKINKNRFKVAHFIK